LNFAVRHGLLAKNVVTGLRKNKGRRLTRFLSVEELARLYAVMDEHVADCPCTERKQGRDIVRLLILTGCRRIEILRLRWDEIDGDQLRIKDSKTGRCDIQLCAEARDILHQQARNGGLYVFPSTLVRDAPVTKIDSFWYAVRQRARLDVFDAAPMTLQRGDRGDGLRSCRAQ
jgi:integrase